MAFEKPKEMDRGVGTSYLQHIYSIWHTGHSFLKDIIRFAASVLQLFQDLVGLICDGKCKSLAAARASSELFGFPSIGNTRTTRPD